MEADKTIKILQRMLRDATKEFKTWNEARIDAVTHGEPTYELTRSTTLWREQVEALTDALERLQSVAWPKEKKAAAT